MGEPCSNSFGFELTEGRDLDLRATLRLSESQRGRRWEHPVPVLALLAARFPGCVALNEVTVLLGPQFLYPEKPQERGLRSTSQVL